MRTSYWLPMVLTLTAGSALVAQADDGGRTRAPRALHDVAVSLGKVKPTRSGSRVKVRLKNRGRSFERGVQVSLWSDAQPATPVWEATTDVRRGGHETWKLVLELPEGTTALTASCDLSSDMDEDESNDDDVSDVPPAAGGGDALAIEGAKLWMPLCSGCHGADGTGGTVDENISDEDAGDILEAVREGEEPEDDEPGMPRFPELDWADAQAIAAFLRNPDVTVPTDPPPTDPPPTDPPPTDPPPTDPPPAAPTYSADVSVILAQYCTACHTGASAAKKIRLDNYTNAAANATKSVNAIASGKMPPGGGTFPPEDLQILRDWIAGGTPR